MGNAAHNLLLAGISIFIHAKEVIENEDKSVFDEQEKRAEIKCVKLKDKQMKRPERNNGRQELLHNVVKFNSASL